MPPRKPLVRKYHRLQVGDVVNVAERYLDRLPEQVRKATAEVSVDVCRIRQKPLRDPVHATTLVGEVSDI